MNLGSNKKVLVLGFYNRNNIGDDAYTLALPQLLTDSQNITFASMDDMNEIPPDTDIVICGGGDIINDYFMQKAQNLLKNYIGPVYGVSIGIPYESVAKYLHLFDHVFVRSRSDYIIATNAIGARNVTYCPDAVFCLVPTPIDKPIPSHPRFRLGVCLAQPLFYNNPKKSLLINSLVNVLTNFHHKNPFVEYHLLAFNYSSSNKECDYIINNSIAKRLSSAGILAYTYENIHSPQEMLDFFKSKIDATLCTRYHSIVFSLITSTPFAALYCSSKVHKLLVDINLSDTDLVCKMNTDKQSRPIALNEGCLYLALSQLLTTTNPVNPPDKTLFSDINPVISKTKTAELLVNNHNRSFEDVLLSCRRNISKYMHIDILEFDTLLYKRQPFPIPTNKSPIELARFICYLISGKVHHPCLWGLSENLTKDNFCLYEALDYIWKYTETTEHNDKSLQTYYPKTKFNRKVILNLDFVFRNDFSQYHRSGWGYVIGALMNLDAPRILRTSDILLDTYVDRSFHWGFDILKTIGVIPYSKPWYGFIHHTFDTTHSDYNCTELFKNPCFIESLSCCKGLIALTDYLGQQLKNALAALNIQVPVFVLYHPMEFVETQFTMQNFLENPNKSVVQIGAWLRNPYAIYELPIPSNSSLTKKALRGKEMDLYFSPPGFFDVMEDTLLRRDWYHNEPTNSISRDVSSHICRPHQSHNSVNKYCSGLFDMIKRNHDSVQVIDRLSNEEYDTLLSENIVFLQLIDCSAVNTVIECIVRNTVLIVNRLPALEEILGVKYPGFYTTLSEAAQMCQDLNLLYRIHSYLTLLDKTRYRLELFMEYIQDIILSGEEWSNSYDLFARPSRNLSVFHVKYPRYLRYLPSAFQYVRF